MTEPFECANDGPFGIFRHCPARKRDAEIARLRAELADESPGTPLGRIAGIAKAAEERGLCVGIEAKPAEVFLIEAFDRLRAELAKSEDWIRVLEKTHKTNNQLANERRETAASRDAEEIARLRKALEPFAEAARWYDQDYFTGDVALWLSRYGVSVSLKVGHLWAARAALAARPPEGRGE